MLATADAFSSLGWPLVAAAGAVTLVPGVAARHMLSNIVGSLQIALNGSG